MECGLEIGYYWAERHPLPQEREQVKPSPGDTGKVQITLAEDLVKVGIGEAKAKSWVDSAIAKAHAFENKM